MITGKKRIWMIIDYDDDDEEGEEEEECVGIDEEPVDSHSSWLLF